jgi:hypothetical protein
MSEETITMDTKVFEGHDSGPWKVELTLDDIAQVCNGNGMVIAEVSSDREDSLVPTAELIAAAPELLQENCMLRGDLDRMRSKFMVLYALTITEPQPIEDRLSHIRRAITALLGLEE